MTRPRSTVLASIGKLSTADWQAVRDRVRFSKAHLSRFPVLIGRPSKNPPLGHHRRQMKELFASATAGRTTFGQRWQVETVNSMIKRNLSSALRARTPHRRSMEMLFRCVVHNIMVLEGTEP